MKTALHNLFHVLEQKQPRFWVILGILLVSMLGIVDYLTGNEIAFSLFYLLPIMLVTLAINQSTGLFIALLSAVTQLIADVAVGYGHSPSMIYFWNLLIRSGLFSFFCFLFDALHRSQQEAELAARTDFVTGAVNARYFHDLLQMEIDRIRRYPHPFTLVYVDIDNFKQVNDLFGHNVGDSVLRFVAEELKSQLRKTDVVARIGGDEFALLLPSVRQPDAERVLSKVHDRLREAMTEHKLPVTFSIGAVTCVRPPYAAEQLVNLADELMYAVKNSTKNGIRCMTLGN